MYYSSISSSWVARAKLNDTAEKRKKEKAAARESSTVKLFGVNVRKMKGKRPEQFRDKSAI